MAAFCVPVRFNFTPTITSWPTCRRRPSASAGGCPTAWPTARRGGRGRGRRRRHGGGCGDGAVDGPAGAVHPAITRPARTSPAVPVAPRHRSAASSASTTTPKPVALVGGERGHVVRGRPAVAAAWWRPARAGGRRGASPSASRMTFAYRSTAGRRGPAAFCHAHPVRQALLPARPLEARRGRATCGSLKTARTPGRPAPDADPAGSSEPPAQRVEGRGRGGAPARAVERPHPPRWSGWWPFDAIRPQVVSARRPRAAGPGPPRLGPGRWPAAGGRPRRSTRSRRRRWCPPSSPASATEARCAVPGAAPRGD